MPGRVVKVLVSVGQSVEKNQPMIVVEAMKMEHTIVAGASGTVASILVVEGAQVAAGAPLVVIE